MGPAIAAAPVAKGAADAGAGGAGLLGKGAADALAPAALGAGDIAAAGAPLDLLSFGTAAGSAIPEAAGAIVPATGALASGLATEPAFAGTLGGAFAPGLDTGAGIFGGTTPGGVAGANAASPLDTAAYPSGPVGAPSGATANPLDNLAAGTTPSGSPIGTTGSVPTSAGASAVAPPAGVNAPVDATSAAAVPAAGGAAPAAGATPGASGGSFLDKLLSGATTSLTKNPLGTALAAGGLAYNVMQGNKQSAAVQALEAQAASQAAQALPYNHTYKMAPCRRRSRRN